MMKQIPAKVILVILDGWGINQVPNPSDAIKAASTPNFDRLWGKCPTTLLEASGKAVGLPDGQMGNSEVGHLTIGSGRVIWQDLPRINQEISSVPDNSNWQSFIKKIKAGGGKAHIAGLFSTGGVHSHLNHYLKILEFLKQEGLEVAIHLFLDGRDSPPNSALSELPLIFKHLSPRARIASIHGRYYAMDRDNRQERTSLSVQAIAGSAQKFEDPLHYIQSNYDLKVSDEFIVPASARDYLEVGPSDGLIMINFRADRMRQILSALTLKFSNILGMTDYGIGLPAIFPLIKVKDTLGEILSKNNIPQLRIAETEKYAHVTFFFNGGLDCQYSQEERILVPSSKVATYDLQPEMSCEEVTNQLVNAMLSEKFNFILVNYANLDMVGHSGNFCAIKKAAEAVDSCLGRVIDAAGPHDHLLITADHGNADITFDEASNTKHTFHTTNPVPFIYYGNKITKLKAGGSLANISSTVLELLNLTPPQEMEGSLMQTRE